MINLTAVGNEETARIDVSIVMPCLNEAKWLAACILNARAALESMHRNLGLSGEIIVADNGSGDGSQLVARAHGARVVDVKKRGYGAALIGGMQAANGRFIVMGDADGSYDFCESTAMVKRLADGADLCMGSRFKGHIAPGAMPWKNRYIGNPALTCILNLFFRATISDAHCGLRALTKACFDQLKLSGAGMEFASELIIKARLKHLTIVEVPVTLSRDLRDRLPHLRPWRDGWRHLRYLLMLSPKIFAVPAALAVAASVTIWIGAGISAGRGLGEQSFFGNYWEILAGGLLGLGHIASLFAAAVHFYGCRQGYREAAPWETKASSWISLESMLLAGAAAFLLGFAILVSIFTYWSQHRYEMIGNILPAVIGTTLTVIGAQNMFGGFLLSIVTGNEADFVATQTEPVVAKSTNNGTGSCDPHATGPAHARAKVAEL